MADGFWTGLGIGAVASPVAIELLKQVAGSVIKRRDERGAETRRLLRGDLQVLHDQVDPLVKLVLAYFSKPSAEMVQEAHQLKRSMTSFAARWNAVNSRMRDAGEKELPLAALVAFRQALTNAIDDMTRVEALATDHPTVEQIYSGALKVADVLSRARYNVV
jgi:hypothetical protein